MADIHIKDSKKGSFTASAKPGESTSQHASRVLSDPKASPAQKKKANFARNARKWKHRGSKRK